MFLTIINLVSRVNQLDKDIAGLAHQVDEMHQRLDYLSSKV